MQDATAWNHAIRFEGGTEVDLSRVIERSIFYHMQHPLLLDMFAEPTASLSCRLRGNGALLVVEPDAQSMRIQRPLGDEGAVLFKDEVGRNQGMKGILAAGLDAFLAEWVKSNCPKSRPPIEQFVEFSDMAEWDSDLRGTRYKTLRSALHHAEREGVRVEPYAPDAHLADALHVFEEWNTHKPRTATHWMPRILEQAARIPGIVGVVARQDTVLMGVTVALTSGVYGYMLMAVCRRGRTRSQEAMDFALLNRLKDLGVRRLDWGVSDGGAVSAYKRKYGETAREPISTFWIPR